MANYFNVPLCWPFKMVPSTDTPNAVSDFDGAWACEQIKSFETRAYYKQKWKRSETTKLQIESSIAPEDLKVYDGNGEVKKSFEWSAVFSGLSYTIYEITFDISDIDPGIYYLYQEVTFGSIDWKAISEPVWSKDVWPNTLSFIYKNSFNDFDVAWTTGIQMRFRCEAGIMDFEPQRGATDYVDQLVNKKVLSGYPSRQFKLYIGTARGVAPYVVDILNRIFDCDYVNIEGVLYTADNDKWEITRVKGYPLIGAAIDIAPSINKRSLQFVDTAPLAPGIVVAYQIETAFFGKTGNVNIIEVETS